MELSQKNIQNNLAAVLEAVREAEKKAGRQPGSVKLLAVSKFHEAQAVRAAMEAGQLLFGENRVQEAKAKFAEIRGEGLQPELHIIGTLQRNKIKDAVLIADCIESVDRLEVLEDIEKHCAKAGKTIQVLFEFHTGEESKSGFETAGAMEQAVALCASGGTPHVIPRGFMTMAPFTDDEACIRRSFSLMRETAQHMQNMFPSLKLDVLSMGMSGDYRIAIEEGSTLVRVGTAIFGERSTAAKQ